jgi:hypothetical protein
MGINPHSNNQAFWLRCQYHDATLWLLAIETEYALGKPTDDTGRIP